jgi:hypothetical protein
MLVIDCWGGAPTCSAAFARLISACFGLPSLMPRALAAASAAITEVELALEVGAPEIIGGCQVGC